MEGFLTPPEHVRFEAKKLFGEIGHVSDGSIAYLQKDGGGPLTPHTHAHDHLFIVVRGRAAIHLDGVIHVIGPNESFLVKGTVPHSVWNDSDGETVMIGLTVLP